MQELRLPRWFHTALVAVMVVAAAAGLILDAKSFVIELAAGLVSFAALILIGAPLLREGQRQRTLGGFSELEARLTDFVRRWGNADQAVEWLGRTTGVRSVRFSEMSRDRAPRIGYEINSSFLEALLPELHSELMAAQVEVDKLWPINAIGLQIRRQDEDDSTAEHHLVAVAVKILEALPEHKSEVGSWLALPASPPSD